jgi:hypothetical protein
MSSALNLSRMIPKLSEQPDEPVKAEPVGKGRGMGRNCGRYRGYRQPRCRHLAQGRCHLVHSRDRVVPEINLFVAR